MSNHQQMIGVVEAINMAPDGQVWATLRFGAPGTSAVASDRMTVNATYVGADLYLDMPARVTVEWGESQFATAVELAPDEIRRAADDGGRP